MKRLKSGDAATPWSTRLGANEFAPFDNIVHSIYGAGRLVHFLFSGGDLVVEVLAAEAP